MTTLFWEKKWIYNNDKKFKLIIYNNDRIQAI